MLWRGDCLSLMDGTHMKHTLIITGWKDCTDGGFSDRKGDVCEGAIG